jgi:ferredoxin
MCVACNGCVDVCPQNLIRLVGLSQLREDEQWHDTIAVGLGITREELVTMQRSELDALAGVMLKDESACIRCGLCASRCPTHAITMKKFEFYRECVTVPAQNAKINYPAKVGNPEPLGTP